MREIFHCIPPYYMIGSDLSGIEARMMGHFTSFFDDGELARELMSGDVHTKTAKAMGISRDLAKTLRYALSFGASPTKVSSILGCSAKEGEIQYKNFYDSNPGLKKLTDYLKEYHKKYKYIKAIDGRRLYSRSTHSILNLLIQGSSAILFKAWSCKIWNEIDAHHLDAAIIISMHDEFQLRVYEKDIEAIKIILPKTLTEVQEEFNLRVELATDTKIAGSWRFTH